MVRGSKYSKQSQVKDESLFNTMNNQMLFESDTFH